MGLCSRASRHRLPLPLRTGKRNEAPNGLSLCPPALLSVRWGLLWGNIPVLQGGRAPQTNQLTVVATEGTKKCNYMS